MIDVEKVLRRDPLAVALKAARIARGMTQRDLSAASGVAQGSISEIERGGKGMTVVTAHKLATALGLELTLSRPAPAVEVPDA